ncbi:hypothetical protein GCK72_021993 [Caenorhabditis remanei]|uniref:Uncharacterized protein n=1 Tax=Caenorhabditis remanei TaxID=31234 RepID=A0A6A5GL77_CAERE|nr:hypothetical protein GCK72_021993 [Caenorhabditis remanei]KAF1755424.1 hypothetical protein GCK72_021993 [Caenorhabditis remanei]
MIAVPTQNVVQLACGFFINFVAFNTQGFIEESVIDSVSRDGSINKHAGYYSLAIIYAFYTVGNLTAAQMVDVLTPKWAMCIGALCYGSFQFCGPAKAHISLKTAPKRPVAECIYPTCVSFTRQIGYNTKGLMALNLICIGIGQVSAGILLGTLGDKTRKLGRDYLILFATLIHVGAYILCALNFPADASLTKTDESGMFWKPNKNIALAIGVLLGFADCCWNTQIMSLLCETYPEKSAQAFAIFKFYESALSCATFIFSSLVSLYWLLGTLSTFAVLALISFFIVERERVEIETTTDSVEIDVKI